jgi:hypothetical protein
LPVLTAQGNYGKRNIRIGKAETVVSQRMAEIGKFR